MTTLQDRINNLFDKFNINLKTEEISEVEVKLEAQAVLENGTVIYTEAASFDEGADVFIVNEEGEKMPLPEGDYTLEDGSVLTIADGGKVAKAASKGGEGEGEGEGGGVSDAQPPKAGKAPPAAKPPAKKKKSAESKLGKKDEEYEEEEDKKEDMEMDEAYIIDLINRVLDERMPSEEVVEEELAADEAVTELTAQLQDKADELTELKSQAASEGVKRVKTTKAQPEVDLKSLSTDERIKALFNKFNS
tara:strand:+ start:18521 stop:19264 length:744 start_codon:yes stop_codon:yes gene_type:complete